MRRLFETENLDLEKAIRMCQAMEATAADMQSLGVKTELGGKVAAIDSRNRKGKGGSSQRTPIQWKSMDNSCIGIDSSSSPRGTRHRWIWGVQNQS